MSETARTTRAGETDPVPEPEGQEGRGPAAARRDTAAAGAAAARSGGGNGGGSGGGNGGVHLFVPMLHCHDAVGEHTRFLRDHLRARGVRSRIYCEIPDPQTAAETRPYVDYDHDADEGDVLVYQFATASKMAGWLADRPERLVLNHHSLTPPRFFRRWNAEIARRQADAERELTDLAPRAELGVAVSEFDAEELRRAGCRWIEIVPVANVAALYQEVDPVVLERLRLAHAGSGAAWLSVGRLAPNKGHERTIAALLAARRGPDPGARLTIVGAPSERHYASALRRFAAELGLADAVEFVTGLTPAGLSARYRASDVLVMLSEHEGFGVPLVEAMAHGLPIVALRAGAVPETAGDAALLIDDPSPRRVAGIVSELVADGTRRNRLAAAGRRRLGQLRLEDAADRFVELVLGIDGAGAPQARAP